MRVRVTGTISMNGSEEATWFGPLSATIRFSAATTLITTPVKRPLWVMAPEVERTFRGIVSGIVSFHHGSCMSPFMVTWLVCPFWFCVRKQLILA